jgi:hypothetical protein
MTAPDSARIQPPRRAAAELVQARMKSGRHTPLLIHARGEDGDLVQCVVKPKGRLTMPPTEYLLEWVASALAHALAIRTPEPLAVEITDALAQAVDAEFAADVRASVGLVFGSTYAAKPFTQLPRDYALSPDQKDAAARILAFDVFIHNFDRRAANQNLFVGRSDFLAFDHEAAFAFLLPVIGGGDSVPDPVLDPCQGLVREHVFFGHLRGKKPSFDGFRAGLEGLTDAFFAELVAATPAEWTTGAAAGKLDRIVDVTAEET